MSPNSRQESVDADAANAHVKLPGLDVTTYPVMVTPDTGLGAVQLTVAELADKYVAVTPVGAFGVAAPADSTLIAVDATRPRVSKGMKSDLQIENVTRTPSPSSLANRR